MIGRTLTILFRIATALERIAAALESRPDLLRFGPVNSSQKLRTATVEDLSTINDALSAEIEVLERRERLGLVPPEQVQQFLDTLKAEEP